MTLTLTPSKNGKPEPVKVDYSDRIPQEQDQHELIRLGAPLDDEEFLHTYFALQDIHKRHHRHGMLPTGALTMLVFLYESGFRITAPKATPTDAEIEAKRQAAQERMAHARAHRGKKAE